MSVSTFLDGASVTVNEGRLDAVTTDFQRTLGSPRRTPIPEFPA